MKTSIALCAALSFLGLVACESKIPQPQPIDRPTADGPDFPDALISDGSISPIDAGGDALPVDGTVGPIDATADGSAPDAARVDVGTDATGDRTVMPTCSFNGEQMAAFATRMGLCTFVPAQESLNRYFRPDTWEGGSIVRRPCPSLQGVATATMGSCSQWLTDFLKYSVTRVEPGATCPSATCSGTSSRVCRDGIEVRDDCQPLGLRCVAMSGEAVCVPPMGETCTAGASPRCNGTVYERCLLGTYTPARDCARTGAVCDAASADGCRGTGVACTEGAVSCDGTFLRVCRGGRLQAMDCGRIVSGAVCQTVMGHAFCGVSVDCDPTTAPAAGTCDGNTLSLCAGGRQYRYVCDARNGFSRCMTGVGCVP